MMFKKSSLISAVIICLAIINADAKTAFGKPEKRIAKPATLEEKIAYGKNLILGINSSSRLHGRSTAKTTVTKSRVIAYAYREFGTSAVQDTAKLFYGSPNRGSDMANQIIQFDSLVSYTYDLSTSALVKDYYIDQTFDANNNILSTTEKYWNETLLIYENSYRSTNIYNASNKVVSTISETWDGVAWAKDSKTTSKYDAAQNKLVDSNFNWNGAAWEPSYVETNTYSATNKLTTSSYTFYDPTSGIWLTAVSLTNTYDASDYLVTTLTKIISMSTATLENNSRSTYTNDVSGNPTIEFQEDWDNVANAWVKAALIYKTFDAAKNNISEIDTRWNDMAGKYDTLNLLNNSFNSYNQLQTEVTSDWDMATSTWDKIDSATYYYEEHTPTSIIEVVKNSASKVYPVPANNEINVSANIGEAQKIQLLIADIQGRPFIQINQNSATDFKQNVSVSNIPSGNYILSIIGEKGFRSVQKITVTH